MGEEGNGRVTQLQKAIEDLKRILADHIPGQELKRILEAHDRRLIRADQRLDGVEAGVAKLDSAMAEALNEFASAGRDIREGAQRITGQAELMKRAHIATSENVAKLNENFGQVMDLLRSRKDGP
jgi:hypothetical protein